ncbi:MAG: 2Fe-2S iron-sulfur cluster-binding protein [Campylobacterota bacterium]|nr:2Fe-2S iron-sulfur cluster-binding protein [Campylobacterota bacterium]
MTARKIEKKMITTIIDGKECHAEFGETILQIARANGIYIPTMCYLTKVEPIASCRMCVVNVEGVDGMILSCQEKATDGAVITTNNEEIFEQRQNIMKLYDVNHPLECGVCDKSGECDLQNKTMEFDVSQQDFTARDQHRPVENWGFISYDPALCIMCEKCVRVCTEVVGDEALAISVGGYNSTIINTRQDEDCSDCGECMAVCPVGALVSTDFKYSSNAWELEKIPASCSHCSAACQMSYEIKDAGISNPESKIYRVTNNFEFSSLCGAGRFGFDFENRHVMKDPDALFRALDAFRQAEAISFTGSVTNEEALILQRFKEKSGVKLLCDEVRGYQRFMEAFSSVTGTSLYNSNLKKLSQSRAVALFGTRINDDAPMVKYHLTMASKHHQARIAYMHPIEDVHIQNIVTQFMKYEAGSEEGVAALLAKTLLADKELPDDVSGYLDDLDIGNLSAESNIGEEELELLKKSLRKKSGFTLVAGADLYAHPKAENIARLLGLIECYSDFDVLLIPPATNALGVSLICELDDEAAGYTIGYNTEGDFVLSALGGGDLDMPALNQQEGTFTSVDKRVVPTHVALPYGGYVLNDIMNALGLKKEYTIDYTRSLPLEKGFSTIEFDALPDYFDITGKEHRGYLLSSVDCAKSESLDAVSDLPTYDGAVLYQCNEGNQFSAFTNKTEQLKSDARLRGSAQFSTVAKLKDGDRVKFTLHGVEYQRVFMIDTSMKGTVAMNPTFDMGLSSASVSYYRFSQPKIERMDSKDE